MNFWHLSRKALIGIGLLGLPTAVPVFSSADPLPQNFPNLNDYTQVGLQEYITARPTWIAFRSSGGDFSCSFNRFDEPGHPTGVHCIGEIPGLDAFPVSNGSDEPCELATLDAGGPQSSVHRQGIVCGRSFQGGSAKTLEAGQKIVNGSATCVAGDDDFTACLVTAEGNHGFVISRDGSWTF